MPMFETSPGVCLHYLVDDCTWGPEPPADACGGSGDG